MSFLNTGFASAASFANSYFETLARACASVDRRSIETAVKVIMETHSRDAAIFTCGNGGSAAISNHFVCDHCKGVATDTALLPRVVSLSSNIEIITAIANDLEFADVFAHQIKLQGRKGDLLVVVSSSGDSENIVRAAETAKKKGLSVIALTGFTGGRAAKIADVSLHVDADNYGVVEDTHQALMHILAQWLRRSHMDPALIPARKF